MQNSKCDFKRQIDGDNPFSHFTGYALASAAQYAVSLHHRKSSLLTHDQFTGHEAFQLPFPQNCFQKG